MTKRGILGLLFYNSYRTYITLLLVALLVALVPAAIYNNTIPAEAHVQPALLDLAAKRPDTQVNVIVQKKVSDGSVENNVARLGGTVTSDLHIINAFGASIPTQAIAPLSKDPGVRWLSLDAPTVKTSFNSQVSSANLQSSYIKTVNADKVWNNTSNYQGTGIGVAVLDSGVNSVADLGTNRLAGAVAFNTDSNHTPNDGNGHGTHIAGIIGGNGVASSGAYIGVAPQSNIINVKVGNDNGNSTTASVVLGLQWINDNRTNHTYNIRVVNISLTSSVSDSYNNDPMDAAVEVLWFNKIVVVTAAGNGGKNSLNAPANDPFVITVGASDDKGTPLLSDDTMASYSSYGTTADGITKPDLVAPGNNIVSTSSGSGFLIQNHPANVVNGHYFRLSGTSMSAPVVSGVVALLLQSNPGLTPDQVKFRLKATAHPFNDPKLAGAGVVDAYAAVVGTTTGLANSGLVPSQLLISIVALISPGSVSHGTINWSTVNWSTVSWSTINWSTINWSTVSWSTNLISSDYWE